MVEVACALAYLKSLPDHPSNRSVGDAVGVSAETVRQYISILALPVRILEHIEEGRLGLDQGVRLVRTMRSRPEILEDLALAACSMTTMETRDLTEYLLRTPDASVSEGRRALRDARGLVVNEYHVISAIDAEAHRRIDEIATRRGTSVSRLVSEIVADWLGRQGAANRRSTGTGVQKLRGAAHVRCSQTHQPQALAPLRSEPSSM